MTPESKLKAEVKDYLKTLEPDCWWFMPVFMGYGIRGIPDFIGCYKGRFFAIETKTPGKKPTPWQDRVSKAIVAAGGWCFVCHTLKSVMDSMDTVLVRK